MVACACNPSSTWEAETGLMGAWTCAAMWDSVSRAKQKIKEKSQRINYKNEGKEWSCINNNLSNSQSNSGKASRNMWMSSDQLRSTCTSSLSFNYFSRNAHSCQGQYFLVNKKLMCLTLLNKTWHIKQCHTPSWNPQYINF